MSNIPLPTRAPSSAEIEAARQLLERIYQAPSAGGTLAGNAAAQQAGGLLIKGASTALLTAGIWVSMQEPAGLPVLQEHLIIHGPRGFFDQMERMLQEKGGDTQAVRALGTTVMGMLDNGQVHSAGLILGQTLAEAQRGGLISPHGDPMDMGISAALRYSQQHPPQAPAQAPSAGVPAAPAPLAESLNTAPQPPALTRELQGLRDRINSGQYANSNDAYDQGAQAFQSLVGQVNALRRAGTATVDDRSLQIAQDELAGRRTHSILGQYVRNAENGGPLPGSADMDRYMGQVRQFNETTRERYGRPMFDPASLDRIEQRLDRTIDFREDMRDFLNRATSGQYANSAQRYEQGTSELEQLRIRSNALAGEGLRGMNQQDYDRSLLQLEGRRINSVMSHVGDQLQQGQPIDPQITQSLVDRAQSLNARSRAGGNGDVFDAGTLDTYGDRNATARFRQDYREFNAQVLSGEFANSDERYRQGQSQLTALVDGANRVLSERGVQPLPQGTLDETGFQLEGRRINSQLSHLQREAEQGRSIDPERTRALVEQAEALNTRRSESGRGDFFDAQTMRDYRELQRGAEQSAAPPATETPPAATTQTPPVTAPAPAPETPAPQTPAPQAPGQTDPDTPPANRPEAPQRDIEREWQEEFGGGELSEQLRREADRQGVSQEDVVDHARRNPSKTANEVLADLRDGQLGHGGTPPGNRPPGSSVAAPGEPDDTPPLDNLTIVRPAPGTLPPASDPNDPLLPYHAVPREERMRAPEPVVHQGQRYDVMGVTDSGELQLQRQGQVTRNIPSEAMFTLQPSTPQTLAQSGQPVQYRGEPWLTAGTSENGYTLRDPQNAERTVQVPQSDAAKILTPVGREVTYDGRTWRFDALESPGWQPGATERGFRLSNPEQPTERVFVPADRANEITMRFAGGTEFQLGEVRHGVIRLLPTDPADTVGVQLQPGMRFEARLRERELEGVYRIDVGENGRLTATGRDRSGNEVVQPIQPSDIASRYVNVRSPDFGDIFQVDAFGHREATLRSRALQTEPSGLPLRDPAYGNLGGNPQPDLNRGTESLQAQSDFIARNAANVPPGQAPSLTVFNIAFSNEGEAERVLREMERFREQHGKDAQIRIVAYEPSFQSFAQSPNYERLQQSIRDNGIQVEFYGGNTSREVIHAKGAIVNGQVLFTTGAVIDGSQHKADISVQLPPQAARTFETYMNEAVIGNAGNARRQELAAELAAQGVLINDPQARLPYIARAQDGLIRGAERELTVSVSELRNPETTLAIIERARAGVDVTLQYREIDPRSQVLLDQAAQQYPNLKVENVSGWQPRPHYNVIAADGEQAYVGTAYLWPNQQQMIHHGRSFENGVLLQGDAVRSLLEQMDTLRRTQDPPARGEPQSSLPNDAGERVAAAAAPAATHAAALDPRAVALLADSRSALEDMNRRVGVNPPPQVAETLAPQVAQQAYAAGFHEVARTDLNSTVRQRDGSETPAGTQLIASDAGERRVVLNIAEALQKTPEQAQAALDASVNASARPLTQAQAAPVPERDIAPAPRLG